MFAIARIALRCRPRQLLPLLVKPPPRTPLPLRYCVGGGGGGRRLLSTDDHVDRASPDAATDTNGTGTADSAGVASAPEDTGAIASTAGSSNVAQENPDTTPENLDIKPENSGISLDNLPTTITAINTATGDPASITIPIEVDPATTTTTTTTDTTPTTTTTTTATTSTTEKDSTTSESTEPPFVPPPFCPGCGAPSQQTSPHLPGYYFPHRPRSERFDSPKIRNKRRRREDEVFEAAIDRLRAALDPQNTELHQTPPTLDTLPPPAPPAPRPRSLRCARCHSMQHHNTAMPLPSYPTLETLVGLLAASKHQRNHIYHLLDAADLPMSLQPDLRDYLWSNLPKEITKNLTISYIVTRADLLVRTHNQIPSLITWMKKTIKDKLPEGEKVDGRDGDDRFWVVSARRGWGIGDVKKEAKHREGGMWLVGAVNVGKSRLVKEVWPEAGRAAMGSMEEAGEFDILPPRDGEDTMNGPETPPASGKKGKKRKGAEEPTVPSPSTLQQTAPTISQIPGTTAAPIRIVYKTAGRDTTSELVDLPGLSRWIGYGPTGLLPYIREEKRKLFHMESFTHPQQYTIKPGQSLVIAGVIMVTPKIKGDDELVMLAYPFLNLPVHLTSTQKAIRLLGERDPEGKVGIKLYQKPFVDETMVEGTARTSDTLDGMAVDPAEPVIDTQAAEGAASATEDIEEEELEEHIDEEPIGNDDTGETAPTEGSVDEEPEEANLPPAVLPPHFKSAGTFPLSNDVTGARDLHLENRSPEALKDLPYRVVSTDVLLSGLGWIELVAQVRKRKEEQGLSVAVEVLTPSGEGVGQRDTLGAHMLREKAARKAGAWPKKVVRQRQSKKGDKKKKKEEKKKKKEEKKNKTSGGGDGKA